MCSKKYYSMKQFKASSKQSHALRSSTWAHFWSLFLSNETCLGVLTEQILFPASTPISKHYQLVFHLLTPSGCCLTGSPIECICWIFLAANKWLFMWPRFVHSYLFFQFLLVLGHRTDNINQPVRRSNYSFVQSSGFRRYARRFWPAFSIEHSLLLFALTPLLFPIKPVLYIYLV